MQLERPSRLPEPSRSSTRMPRRSSSRVPAAATPKAGQSRTNAFRLCNTLNAPAQPVVAFDMSLWSGSGTNFNYAGANVIKFSGFSGTEGRVEGTGNRRFRPGLPGAEHHQRRRVRPRRSLLLERHAVPEAPACGVRPDGHQPLTQRGGPDRIPGTAIQTLGEAILAKWPDSGILAVVQNQRNAPALNITERAIRSSHVAGLAGSQR